MINIDKLREALKDPTQMSFIGIVKILENKEIATDGSAYQVTAELVPEGYECLVNVTQNENLQSGIKAGQLWLTGFIEGKINEGFLIRQIVTIPDPLHPKARMDETVISSLQGKNINISNNQEAVLNENAVLGQSRQTHPTCLLYTSPSPRD